MYPVTTMGWVGDATPVAPAPPAPSSPAILPSVSRGSALAAGVAIGILIGWIGWGRKRR